MLFYVMLLNDDNMLRNTKYICMIINYKIYEKQKSIDFHLNNILFLVIFVMDGPGKALTVFLKFLKKKR